MIREATSEDIPRIVEMGSRSLLDGPYREQIADNPEQAALLALQVIHNQNGRVLVAEEDGKVIGLMALILFPHYFSGELTAGELMWYVEPEFRQSFTSLALLRGAERLARDAGAKRMQFTAPTSDVASAYKSLGYSQVEVSFQKAL